jgi:DNA polymerase III subunit epsilon
MSLAQRVRLALARRSCKLPLQAQLLRLPLPRGGTRIARMEMLALAIETTGRDPAADRVIAAGWVLLAGDRILMASARELRVRDDGPHGVRSSPADRAIANSDLDDADSVDEMLVELLPEVAGRAVVAHAASIQRDFLAAVLRRAGGVPLPNPFIDTMSIERRLLESEGVEAREAHGDLVLDACRARRGLPAHQRNSAGANAVACAELLLAQLERLGDARRMTLRALL